MKMTVLAGDIGGTKTVLRLVSAEPDSTGHAIPLMTTLREKTYPSRSFADLVPMVHQFFTEAAGSVSIPAVDCACFGTAGVIADNASELTNLSWSLSGERLERSLASIGLPSSMTLPQSDTELRDCRMGKWPRCRPVSPIVRRR
jgi:glucokinase